MKNGLIYNKMIILKQSYIKIYTEIKLFFKKHNFWILYIVSLLSSFAILYLKAKNIETIDDLLYNEDGSIFMSGANYSGLYSFLLTYSGYFHSSMRFVAYCASLFDYSWQPLIFLLGNLFLYSLSVFIILITLKSNKVHFLFIYFAIVLLFFQPYNQEVMLNLTNTHWIMAVAFIVYAFAYQNKNKFYYNMAIGIIFGLSGPFSVLILPLLIIKHYFTVNKKNNEFVLFTSITALIQILAMLKNPRMPNESLDIVYNKLSETIPSLLKGYFVFQSNNLLIIIACISIYIDCICFLL